MGLKKKRKNIIVLVFLLSILLIILTFAIVNNNKKVTGKIYFNKPVSWEQAYAYLCDEDGNELLGKWPGTELSKQEDYIYFFEVATKNNIKEHKLIFNDGNKYQIEENGINYNKIYNVTTGIGEKNKKTIGEWLDYSEDIKIGKIPTTESKIKNVIYMIGDGMGENHIIAGGIYLGESLNIQKITDKSYVKTSSLSTTTDSAAGATALATGHKTKNEAIGLDKHGNYVQNLMEYAKTKGMKTGIVCTQILNHATPAGFTVHYPYRYNYEEIAQLQIESGIDLMLGGGRKYFSLLESQMLKNNYTWINELSELKNINKNEKVIGTFAEESISKETNRTSLASMTREALSRLENDKGFLMMIEGSDIDSYSHDRNMNKMLMEMIDFDKAVEIAISYVNKHSDTLLIVTADHETGGLNLDGVFSKEQLTNLLFTSNGQHTDKDVLIYAYGLGAKDITKYDVIDNTSIYEFIKQGLENNF